MNAIKKKEYIKPEMKVLQMEIQAILAGSYIRKTTEDDYRNLDEYIEEDCIYAD
ncbi:hypothetical protein [uncultured Prevotella sp.]|uniref:hypothetical protein n=1 Tax=uncultured Prevotella sp. TaxID=159272 RepID=UPI0027E37899|nr:hypothetical protein [uncultured Prevotella sp.]